MNKLYNAFNSLTSEEQSRQLIEFLKLIDMTLYGVSLHPDKIRNLCRNLDLKNLRAEDLQK